MVEDQSNLCEGLFMEGGEGRERDVAMATTIASTSAQLAVLISQVAELKAQFVFLNKGLDLVQQHHADIARLDIQVKSLWAINMIMLAAVIGLAIKVLIP